MADAHRAFRRPPKAKENRAAERADSQALLARADDAANRLVGEGLTLAKQVRQEWASPALWREVVAAEKALRRVK